MFFARVRWGGRVLDGAGIDTDSQTGRELSNALLKFSKYCQEKNRRVAEHIAERLALSESDAEALLARTRDSAIELAERDRPNLLPSQYQEEP